MTIEYLHVMQEIARKSADGNNGVEVSVIILLAEICKELKILNTTEGME